MGHHAASQSITNTKCASNGGMECVKHHSMPHRTTPLEEFKHQTPHSFVRAFACWTWARRGGRGVSRRAENAPHTHHVTHGSRSSPLNPRPTPRGHPNTRIHVSRPIPERPTTCVHRGVCSGRALRAPRARLRILPPLHDRHRYLSQALEGLVTPLDARTARSTSPTLGPFPSWRKEHAFPQVPSIEVRLGGMCASICLVLSPFFINLRGFGVGGTQLLCSAVLCTACKECAVMESSKDAGGGGGGADGAGAGAGAQQQAGGAEEEAPTLFLLDDILSSIHRTRSIPKPRPTRRTAGGQQRIPGNHPTAASGEVGVAVASQRGTRHEPNSGVPTSTQAADRRPRNTSGPPSSSLTVPKVRRVHGARPLLLETGFRPVHHVTLPPVAGLCAAAPE